MVDVVSFEGVFVFESTEECQQQYETMSLCRMTMCDTSDITNLNLYRPYTSVVDRIEMRQLAIMTNATKSSVMGALFYIAAARRRNPIKFEMAFSQFTDPNVFLIFILISNKFILDRALSNREIVQNTKVFSLESLNYLELQAFRCLDYDACLNILLLDSI